MKQLFILLLMATGVVFLYQKYIDKEQRLLSQNNTANAANDIAPSKKTDKRKPSVQGAKFIPVNF